MSLILLKARSFLGHSVTIMALLRALLLLLLLVTGAQPASACTDGHAGSLRSTAAAQDQLPCVHAADCCECQAAFAGPVAPAFESHKSMRAGSAAGQAPWSVPSALVPATGRGAGIAPVPQSLPVYLITSRLRL